MVILIKLGIAYYNQGFINIPTRYSELFGTNMSEIKVHLDEWSSAPLVAYINRTAQVTKAPRIMMGAGYTEWVQSKYKIGDKIKIELQSEKNTKSILIR